MGRQKFFFFISIVLIGVCFIQGRVLAENLSADTCDTSHATNLMLPLYDEPESVQLVPIYSRATFSYHMYGGSNPSDAPYIIHSDDLPIDLPVPEREGYNFAGWYTDSNYTEKISSITIINQSKYELYARWTEAIDTNYNLENYNYHKVSLFHESTGSTLLDYDYSLLEDVAIPGMPSTREMDSMQEKITSENQCPQGICLTEDYILISSYPADSEEVPGCLYIFDIKDGSYLTTLGMKVGSHLGGITYDGENVWVCHSDNNTIQRLSYKYIQTLVRWDIQSTIDISKHIEAYEVSNKPSCITYYDGELYVATTTKIFQSVMVTYSYDSESDTLEEGFSYRIPSRVQGLAFDDKGHVYYSTSYGRTCSSYLKVYERPVMIHETLGSPIMVVEMPPCSEEIEFVNGDLYVLFESAGFKYFEGTDGNGTAEAPIDKVVIVHLDE